MLNIMALIKY